MFKFLIPKRRINFQIEEYINWKAGRCLFGENQKRRILDFIKIAQKDELEYITIEDVFKYKEHIQSQYHGAFELEGCMTTIRCMFRYYKARGLRVIKPDLIKVDLTLENANIKDMTTVKVAKTGRPPKIAKIERVNELRKVGLSYRQIAAIMKEDVKSIYRWNAYVLED